MPNLQVPHIPLVDAQEKTWSTRLQLMTECSCACQGKDKEGYSTLGVPRMGDAQIAVHATCRMPRAKVLAKLVQECDNCERWYISRELPDRWLNCAGCS